jgi:methyl-accepting chemotaxis protein
LIINESVSISLKKAISAHMIFTGKIRAHLDGNQRLDPDGLATHLTCAFGKWYRSKGEEQCGTVPGFREIDTPHAKVHELGRQAVAAFNAGNRKDAEQKCREMLLHSGNLIDILNKLEKQHI